MLRLLHFITFCYVVFLTSLLWLPDPRVVLYGWEPVEEAIDYAHLITFTLLGFLVELGRRKRSVRFWIILLVLYTFGTETVQALTAPLYRMFELPTRSFDLIDICHDLCGETTGLTLAAVCRFCFRRKNLARY